MGDYRKVLRTKFKAICGMCNHVFDLTEEYMAKQDKTCGIIPFSAKSSNSSIICPKCNYSEFRLNFIYKNLYRRRCPKCRQMFETEDSWKNKCDKCAREHTELMASMGPEWEA